MQRLEEVKNILSDVLSLGERKNSLTKDSMLLGDIPELDSMAVVNVITALEEGRVPNYRNDFGDLPFSKETGKGDPLQIFIITSISNMEYATRRAPHFILGQ